MKRAVFFDRDGTLNEMVYDETHGIMDSPRHPEQVRLMPGAASAIRRLREHGFLIVVVTNQPGLAKGTMTKESLDAVNTRLTELLREQDAAWDALYYCPHHPNGQPGNPYTTRCNCRKPLPGLLTNAAQELNISLQNSWMIGDGIVDIQAGRAAGCRTILMTSLKLEHIERFIRLNCEPDFCVSNPEKAADSVLSSPDAP